MLALAGCGDDVWEAGQTSPCPALPSGVVADVAVDLLPAEAAEKERSPAAAESGSLPPADGATGLLYSCAWRGTSDPGGLRISLETASAGDLEEAERTATQVTAGRNLTGSVSGQGRAWPANDGAQAMWWCENRLLSVEVASPSGDPVEAAAKLTESLLPQTGCTPT